MKLSLPGKDFVYHKFFLAFQNFIFGDMCNFEKVDLLQRAVGFTGSLESRTTSSRARSGCPANRFPL